MAKYTSRYLELGFYVGGDLKRFSNGHYETTNKDELAVLDTLSDVKKEAEEKPAAAPKRKMTKEA